jgi:hypothetical protein
VIHSSVMDEDLSGFDLLQGVLSVSTSFEKELSVE